MIASTDRPSAWPGAALSAGLHASALVLMAAAVSGGAAMVQEGRDVRAIPVAVVAPDAVAAPAAAAAREPGAAPQRTAAEAVPEPGPAPPPREAEPAPPHEPAPVEEAEPPPEPEPPDTAVEDALASADESPAMLPKPRPDRPPPTPPEPAAPEAAEAPAPEAPVETAAEGAGAATGPRRGAQSADAPTGAQFAALPLAGDDDGLVPPVVTDPRFRAPPTPPDYPRRAVRRALEGVVLVRALVDPSGRAGEIVVWRSSGHDVLDAAARAAVARWKFEPARRAGRAITAWVQVPVAFRLK